MNKFTPGKIWRALFSTVLASPLFIACVSQAMEGKVSELGKYEGYSEAIYDGTQRISDYLTLADGTRLAYDLILPTKGGLREDKPLPVLFKYTPYLRTYILYNKDGKNMVADLYRWSAEEQEYVRRNSRPGASGRLLDPLLRNRYLGALVKHGYAIIVVERPGTGASFGRSNMAFEAVAREANEVLNWISAQPWCDGNIGMYGESWQGQTQLAAASTGNRHLKAIFPAATWLDNYSAVMYPGGVYDRAFAEFFAWTQKILSSEVITPVDHDEHGILLAKARQERSQGQGAGPSFADFTRRFPFRDSSLPNGIKPWIDAASAYRFLERINRSGIPIYLVAGWYDLCARDMFLWYVNLTVPRKLLVRPLDHSRVDADQFDLDYTSEMHRWFDYWLKGIDNGLMKESPIKYYLMGEERENAWKTADEWPPKNGNVKRYYFGSEDGKRGALNLSPPADKASDRYTVDYTTTTGKNSRWSTANWPISYPNMRSNDAKALTYTTPPLDAAIQVVGHPLMHLWIRTDSPDLDVFAYLEEVDENGNSIYITEGVLRASHRTQGKAPYENFGLPYHTHSQSDLKPIPAGEVFGLNFDLLPTAYQFSKGSRIRVTISFADSDNFETPVITPAPVVHMISEMNHLSGIDLPIVLSW